MSNYYGNVQRALRGLAFSYFVRRLFLSVRRLFYVKGYSSGNFTSKLVSRTRARSKSFSYGFFGRQGASAYVLQPSQAEKWGSNFQFRLYSFFRYALVISRCFSIQFRYTSRLVWIVKGTIVVVSRWCRSGPSYTYSVTYAATLTLLRRS